ncbi:hypothetical protein K1I43_03065 [Anoxybacillus sp. ST70]|nr:hypothetical protein [Anoxybacillus sp. ST70]MBW9217505.1 hypothetical protein [Anoxybacillus sp. ST70]OAO76808.1 hypothetical protein A0O32_2706 [Anoxybacillus flavithermus]
MNYVLLSILIVLYLSFRDQQPYNFLFATIMFMQLAYMLVKKLKKKE